MNYLDITDLNILIIEKDCFYSKNFTILVLFWSFYYFDYIIILIILLFWLFLQWKFNHLDITSTLLLFQFFLQWKFDYFDSKNLYIMIVKCDCSYFKNLIIFIVTILLFWYNFYYFDTICILFSKLILFSLFWYYFETILILLRYYFCYFGNIPTILILRHFRLWKFDYFDGKNLYIMIIKWDCSYSENVKHFDTDNFIVLILFQ